MSGTEVRRPGEGTIAELELSGPLRTLLALTAAAYVVVGLPLFLAPAWASTNFAWNVSPFVAMTAGGWCLGTAAFAVHGVISRRWSAVRPCIVYVFSFGLTQMAVAIYERELLRTAEPLTWPYLAALGLSVFSGAVALGEGRRQFAPDRRPGLALAPFQRRLMVAFVALVFFLALVAFIAPARATDGAIFPEPLSLFSLRAFGVFYLSLGLGMLVLVKDTRADAFLVYMRAGLVLVALILAATVVYWDSFDPADHPFQVVYPLAYVVALVGALVSLGWERRQERG